MNLEFILLIVSFIVTTLLGLIVLPILRKLKIGQYIREEGPSSHLAKSGTPTMGGIIMLVTIVVITSIMGFWYNQLWLLLLPILGFGLVGFLDDYTKLVLKNNKGISAKTKMLALLIVSGIFVIVVLNLINIGTDVILPIFKQPYVLPLLIYIPFIIFILISSTNALNLTDGLDALATGITVIIMTFITIYAMKVQNEYIAVLGSIVTGACLAFLIFNINPAKVFMGDTGSLALGGIIAICAIVLKIPFHLIFIMGMCIVDTVSVILQVSYFKLTNGKRLFKMAPFHHHLELSGMKETNIVWLFWTITIVLTIIAYFI